MRSLPEPASNGVIFASGGLLLLTMLPLPPVLTALGVVAMLALMFLGIAAEWRKSRDEVQKHVGGTAAIGAIPIAILCAFLTVLVMRFWPDAADWLARIAQSRDEPSHSTAFAFGAVTAFFWLLLAHFALVFVWWGRSK